MKVGLWTYIADLTILLVRVGHQRVLCTTFIAQDVVIRGLEFCVACHNDVVFNALFNSSGELEVVGLVVR